MAGYTALSDFSEHDIPGTGTWVRLDRVHGGTMDHEGGEPKHLNGIGGQDSIIRGIVTSIGNAPCYLQGGELLANVQRATVPALPLVIEKIQGGVLSEIDGCRLQEDCYIDSCEISCDVEGPVIVTYNWKALKETQLNIATPNSAPKASNLIFSWFTTSILLNGLAYKAQRFTARLNNGLVPQSSLDENAVVDTRRWVEWFDPGIQEVSLDLDLRLPTGINLMRDYVPALSFIFIAHNEAGDTFTLDMTGSAVGLHPVGVPQDIGASGADEKVWRVNFESDHNDLAVWDAAVT